MTPELQRRGIRARTGGSKPVYLAETGSRDPVAHALAENLFWNDIMAEHARFFVMLMPGKDLADERTRADGFRRNFTEQFERARTANLDRNSVASFSRTTMERIKPFVDWKQNMREQQASGRIHSLVWPLFFEHTAREGEWVVQRLDALQRREIELDRDEAIDFWTLTMAEHANFVAHLLDPEENRLVTRAFRASDRFHELHTQATGDQMSRWKQIGLGDDRGLAAERPGGSYERSPRSTRPGREDDRGDSTAAEREIVAAADDIIDFKSAAERGIRNGTIRSIIHPLLADHVRREAVKFADDLKRVGMETSEA